MERRLSDSLGQGIIPAIVVDWEAVTSRSADHESDVEMNDLDPERTIGELAEAELDD